MIRFKNNDRTYEFYAKLPASDSPEWCKSIAFIMENGYLVDTIMSEMTPEENYEHRRRCLNMPPEQDYEEFPD